MQQSLFDPNQDIAPPEWVPTSEAGLKRLESFAPYAGRIYAQKRNFDFGVENRQNISALSPWLRHRLILEEDVLKVVLSRHRLFEAEKFVQEVFWRGYFKGWLEHRPEVWSRYKQNLGQQINKLENDNGFANRYQEAVSGRTGIACFDRWAEDLIETGYLHNHARMWFASIWIFTLNLPWELGADFFYRHLLDGDPASNTCSWRWVGGLHTVGKTYCATASNISRFTNNRFNPAGQLSTEAISLQETTLAEPKNLSFSTPDFAGLRVGFIMTEEDCNPLGLLKNHHIDALLCLSGPTKRSFLKTSEQVVAFSGGAVLNAFEKLEKVLEVDSYCTDHEDWKAAIKEWISCHSLDVIVTSRHTVGPVRQRLVSAIAELDVPLVEITRAYDAALWPNTKAGFFKLKKKIPSILSELGIV